MSNKLIRKIYFDESDIQGKLDSAVESLQSQEVGTTQEVDGITVTKQSEDSFIASQDGDVVNVEVTPDGLSVTEATTEVVEFSGPDKVPGFKEIITLCKSVDLDKLKRVASHDDFESGKTSDEGILKDALGDDAQQFIDLIESEIANSDFVLEIISAFTNGDLKNFDDSKTSGSDIHDLILKELNSSKSTVTIGSKNVNVISEDDFVGVVDGIINGLKSMKLFSDPGLSDMVKYMNWSDWKSVQGELDELKDSIKDPKASSTLKSIAASCWNSKDDWENNSSDIKKLVESFVESFKDTKLFDSEDNVDIKTLLFSDEELELSPSVANQNVDVKTPLFPGEKLNDNQSPEEVIEVSEDELTSEELELFSEVAGVDVSTIWDEAKKSAVAAFSRLTKPTKELLAKFIKELEETAANAPKGGRGGKMFDDEDDSDLSNPDVSNAELFKKESNTVVENGSENFDEKLSNEELFKIENSKSGNVSLEGECRDNKY